MAGSHYVIEGSPYGMLTVRPSDSDRPIANLPSLERALEYVKHLNADDVPEIMPPLG